MAYALPLVQINANIRGLVIANAGFGFPSGAFHTLLMSYWMCGPIGSAGTASIWPDFFSSAEFFKFGPGANSVALTNHTLGSGSAFYQATFASPTPGTLMHFLLSVDTHAQTVQVYINDQPVTLTGTAWTGTPPFDFTINPINDWFWEVAGVLAAGVYPALADVWITNPPSFVDLSVTANRRKFINRDLTPVDLGNTGTEPFGTTPNIYMSVRPGGVATDFLTNRGSGGGTWSADQNPPTMQAAGVCPLPPPPPPLPPPGPSLAMDNLIGLDLTPATVAGSQIFLMWSDDRGHTYGSPVGQPIGRPGAYLTSPQWQRLGYARDRVFKLEWSVPVATALQGAFIDVDAQAKS